MGESGHHSMAVTGEINECACGRGAREERLSVGALESSKRGRHRAGRGGDVEIVVVVVGAEEGGGRVEAEDARCTLVINSNVVRWARN